jgi:DNA-binding NtrC family response regulator
VVERTPAAALRRAGETEQAMSDVVLIADDDKDIVRFVALNLRLEGFDVVAVHDGREALAKPSICSPASSC